MATGSIITIANRSLGSISARANIQNINEGSTESNAVNVYFQSTFEALARSALWGCLKKQAPLSLVAAAPGTPENPQGALTPYPPTPWWYTYLVPADSLYVRQLIPPPSVLQNTGGTPIFPVNNYIPYNPYARKHVPYEIMLGQDQFGNAAETIVTNLSQAQAIYTANQPNPAFWDSLFQQAMVASLAVFLSASVSGDKALTQSQRQVAEALIMKARAADGNENPTSQSREASWISARNGETGPWALGQNGPNLNYSNMAWPVL